MTVLVELEPGLEARVTAQAKKRGIPLPQYLHGLIAQAEEVSSSELLGWPAGFFDETYGTLASDPVERLPQAESDTRDRLA